LTGKASLSTKSLAGKGHRIYPYLLRGVKVVRPDEVWSTDITYVPLASGFMYLAAVIDWFSPYVIAWRLSNPLDGSFCLEMLDEALRGAGLRSSTPTRGCSSRRRRSPGRWRRPVWR
jgi:transposase InsO family protein